MLSHTDPEEGGEEEEDAENASDAAEGLLRCQDLDTWVRNKPCEVHFRKNKLIRR